MRKIKSKDAYCDVQNSSLNSSLAEVLASMSLSAAGAEALGLSGDNNTAQKVRAASPVLGEHEILSSSLQEFLKYDDPLSPLADLSESVVPEKVRDGPVAHESASPSPSRSPRFVVSRNPSFTPSLKGFLFSAEQPHQDSSGDFLAKLEVSCAPTAGTESKSQSLSSSSASSDPRSYMPRLTDGSVSVLHSLGHNNANENNNDEMSSLDDSMRMSDDESSSTRDRDNLREMIDLGPVKEELEKSLGRNNEEHSRLIDQDGGADPATSTASDFAPQSHIKPSSVQALIESFEVYNGVVKPTLDVQKVTETQVESASRPSSNGEMTHQQHRTVTISPMKKPKSPLAGAQTPPSERLQHLTSPAQATVQEVSLRLTSQPESCIEPSTMSPTKASRLSSAASSPRRSSLGKAEPERPAASPSRPRNSSVTRRTSLESAGSPRQQALPSSPITQSPTPSTSKRRTKSSPRLTSCKNTVVTNESTSLLIASASRPSETSPEMVKSSFDYTPAPTAIAAFSKTNLAQKIEASDKGVVAMVSVGPVSENVTVKVTTTDHPVGEQSPSQRKRSNTEEESQAMIASDLPASTPSESSAAALPIPKTPKSPRRELRLKIQIDEMMTSQGKEKQAVASYNIDGAGIEDDALPQVLKTLLDGVASKIRKHAKQESMRKIRTKEAAETKEKEVASPDRCVIRVDLPSVATGTETSPSAKQRIKVRVEKSGESNLSPLMSRIKSRDSNSRSPRKPESQRAVPRDAGHDLIPHAPDKGDRLDVKERSVDPSKSPKRHKSRDREERSRSRSARERRQRSEASRLSEDWDPQVGPQPDGVTESRARRRSVERGASSKRISSRDGTDDRTRSHSSSESKQSRIPRASSKARSSTPRSRTRPGYDTSGSSISLMAKLERGDKSSPQNAHSTSKSVSSRSSRKGYNAPLQDDDHDNALFVRASLSEALEKSNNKLKGTFGSKSVCSKSSRKQREGESSKHDRRPSISGSQSVSSKSSRKHREEGSTRQGRRSSLSGSQSVCSRSSRKQREVESGSRSHHSKSTHSISKSTHSASKSARSSSRSVNSTKSASSKAKQPRSEILAEDHAVTDQAMSEVMETIEYDFNDEVPDRGALADARGRSYRRGNGSSTTRGRSQSARHLRTTQDGELGIIGPSQRHYHESTERKTGLSKSGRSQSHRQLSSSVEKEHHLGISGSGLTSRSSARSSSQPPKAGRQSREGSVERSGSSRRRSSSRPTEGRMQGSGRGLSRQQIEEGVTSVASGASDKTPRRSGGRGPSPNARSRQQPTAILKQTVKMDPPTEPPGQSPVEQHYAPMTVGRLRGVQKALSFRDLFGRESDPWQEFTSPASRSKPSCLPLASTGLNTSTTTATTATTATTTMSAKGRSMPKFLSSMSNSFHRSISLRGFPEVSKADLEASFDAFPNSSERSGNQGWTPKLFR